MRRLLAVAPILLTFVWATSPLCAQHGGGGYAGGSHGGGFSGHSGPSFHGGFSGPGSFTRGFSPGGPSVHGYSGPSRSGFRTLPAYNFRVPWANEFNGVQHNSPGRSLRTAPGFARTFPGNSFNQSAFSDRSHHRGPYRPPYRRDRDHHQDRDDYFSGSAIWPGWIGYGYLGYPSFDEYPPLWDYDSSDDSSGSQPYAPQQDYASQPQDYGPQAADQQQSDYPDLPPWPTINTPQNSAPPRTVSAPPQTAEPVTLVFNDGRPPEKIHNYLLTAGTLYVMDEQRREIPVAELNLAATAKVNREAGVDFKLPGTPQ
jgi:hypothetical protein